MKTASRRNGMDHRPRLVREDVAVEDWNPAHLGPLVAARLESFGGIAPPSNLLPQAIAFEGEKFCLIRNDSHSTGRGLAAALGR